MRYPTGHKEKTRARIVEAAGKVFRRGGYQASGVDEVMEEAGLTAGGFYAHFGSKEALLVEAIATAGAETGLAHEVALEAHAGAGWVDAFLDRYLSVGHVREFESGCPLPALVSEVCRASEPVKRTFESIVLGLADKVASHVGEKESSDDRFLAVIALCVGGVGLARSVQDPEVADRLLEACREAARKIIKPA